MLHVNKSRLIFESYYHMQTLMLPKTFQEEVVTPELVQSTNDLSLDTRGHHYSISG